MLKVTPEWAKEKSRTALKYEEDGRDHDALNLLEECVRDILTLSGGELGPNAAVYSSVIEQLVLKYNTLGVWCYRNHDNDTSAAHFERALQVLQKANSVEMESETDSFLSDILQRLLATTYNNMGCMERNRGNTDHALELLQKSADVDSLNPSAATMLNMSALCTQLNNKHDALFYARQALVVLEARTESECTATSNTTRVRDNLYIAAHHNIAIALEALDLVGDASADDEITYHYEKALEYAEKLLGAEHSVTINVARNFSRWITRQQKRTISHRKLQNRRKMSRHDVDSTHPDFQKRWNKRPETVLPSLSGAATSRRPATEGNGKSSTSGPRLFSKPSSQMISKQIQHGTNTIHTNMYAHSTHLTQTLPHYGKENSSVGFMHDNSRFIHHEQKSHEDTTSTRDSLDLNPGSSQNCMEALNSVSLKTSSMLPSNPHESLTRDVLADRCNVRSELQTEAQNSQSFIPTGESDVPSVKTKQAKEQESHQLLTSQDRPALMTHVPPLREIATRNMVAAGPTPMERPRPPTDSGTNNRNIVSMQQSQLESSPAMAHRGSTSVNVPQSLQKSTQKPLSGNTTITVRRSVDRGNRRSGPEASRNSISLNPMNKHSSVVMESNVPNASAISDTSRPTEETKLQAIVEQMKRRLVELLEEEELWAKDFKNARCIQNLYRKHVAQRKVQLRRNEREQGLQKQLAGEERAACILKCFFRRVHRSRREARQRFEAQRHEAMCRQRAAIRIQTTARSWLAKRAAKRARAHQAHFISAVRTVQNWFRRLLAQSNVSRRSVFVADSRARRYNHDCVVFGAQTIQRLWRAQIARRKTSLARGVLRAARELSWSKLRHHSCTLIQKLWRGHLARIRASRLRARRNQKQQQMDFWKKCHDAATRIQATFRRHVARKQYTQLYQEHVVNKRLRIRLEQERAALLLQSQWRRVRASRSVQEMASFRKDNFKSERMAYFASRISALWRGYSYRKQVQNKIDLERVANQEQERMMEQRYNEMAAARIEIEVLEQRQRVHRNRIDSISRQIQLFLRARLSSMSVRRHRYDAVLWWLKRDAAIRLVQRVGRAFYTRKQFSVFRTQHVRKTQSTIIIREAIALYSAWMQVLQRKRQKERNTAVAALLQRFLLARISMYVCSRHYTAENQFLVPRSMSSTDLPQAEPSDHASFKHPSLTNGHQDMVRGVPEDIQQERGVENDASPAGGHTSSGSLFTRPSKTEIRSQSTNEQIPSIEDENLIKPADAPRLEQVSHQSQEYTVSLLRLSTLLSRHCRVRIAQRLANERRTTHLIKNSMNAIEIQQHCPLQDFITQRRVEQVRAELSLSKKLQEQHASWSRTLREDITALDRNVYEIFYAPPIPYESKHEIAAHRIQRVMRRFLTRIMVQRRLSSMQMQIRREDSAKAIQRVYKLYRARRNGRENRTKMF